MTYQNIGIGHNKRIYPQIIPTIEKSDLSNQFNKKQGYLCLIQEKNSKFAN